MIVAIIFITILVLLGLLLFVPIRIGVEYRLSDKKQDTKLVLSVLGVRIKIPVTPGKKKKKKKEPTPPKEKTDYGSFKSSVTHFVQSYHQTKDRLKKSLHYLRTHISCSEFRFTLRFGMGDAAKTGIMTGAAWTTGTLLLRTIDGIIGIKNLEMNVYPDFNQQRLDVHILCILRVQIVHIINVGIQAFKIISVFTEEDSTA